jgi:hypothetical protein
MESIGMGYLKRLSRFLIVILTFSALGSTGLQLTTAHPATNITARPAHEDHMVGDIGFRPKANGFSFENYTNTDGIQNLNETDMRRLFGDRVCASTADGKCILTPPAQEYMDSTNKGMNGGHCEGMAALSLILFFQQKEKPADFGADTTAALQLKDNTKLQNEIALYFTTQATSPARDGEIKGKTPNDILDLLIAAMKPGETPTETYTMGIYQPEFKGGHAITPYAVVDKGGDKFWVMVYDNNYPGDERQIEIDRQANTWLYTASINPSEPASEYKGDANTKTLTITATSPRLQQQVCSFCGGGDAGSAKLAPALQYNQITLDGEVAINGAQLLITDDKGNKLGYAGDKFVNDIPGAQFTPSKSAELWKDNPSPTYFIPVGTKFTVTLDGSQLKSDEPVDLTMIGPGHDISLQGIKLSAGQVDTVAFSPDGTQFTYKPSGNEAPNMIIGIEHNGADYEFDLKGTDVDKGGSVTVSLDYTKGQLLVHPVDTKNPTKFDLTINKIDDKGETTFTKQGISVDPDKGLYIDFTKASATDIPTEAQ